MVVGCHQMIIFGGRCISIGHQIDELTKNYLIYELSCPSDCP